ncbi:MAG: hypothetical protein JWO87_466 [Phycisphaerales bacterium]|nr:hypothetical protein [Phycisphaerales bacterium]MDB5298803.1 hypothetical protein [Phycisphaerales bacterium]
MEFAKLRELRLAQPFRPFYLIIDDGRRLFVGEPHQLGMAPDGSRMGVVTKTGMALVSPNQVRDVDLCAKPFKQ